MEFNSYASYDSSSSSQFFAYGQEEKRVKARPSFYSSLHAVQKLPTKPMKKPIAPLPPTKPKVYKVDPVNFKDVVQRLTAAPEFQRRRLDAMAPPALDLSTTTAFPLHLSATLSSPKKTLQADQVMAVERKTHNLSETCGALSPLGFSFSPSALGWTFYPLLSPGTLSSLEQSTVL